MAATTAGGGRISFARFVLDTVEQVRALGGVSASDPDLKRISVSSVTFSIPCDQGEGQPPLRPPAVPLRQEELVAYLKSNERRIVVNWDRLLNLPEGRLGWIELTVVF